MSYHKLMLENQTMFTKMVFEQLSDRQLSVGQPKVLEYLFTHDGAIQKTIAQACQIEPATVTSLLSRMEKSGLIERKYKDDDKRYICVYLTESGRNESECVVNAFNIVEKIALRNFAETEKEQFKFFLKRVNSNLGNLNGGNSNEQKGNI